MAEGSDSGARKRERQQERQRAAALRRRRRRLQRGGIVATVVLIPFLWILDRTGAEEVVDARVVRTRPWRHRPQDGTPHTHSNATIVIRGLNKVMLRQADGLEEGERVPVRIRRGRLTGWPYFMELAQPTPGEPAGDGEPAPLPDAGDPKSEALGTDPNAAPQP
jgi:hypothetical protein